jgi:DegV family protein with EDD domain
MGFTALVSDSTANLPAEFVTRHNVRVVPLYIRIGETVYRDGVDISSERVYELLPHSAAVPTTSQPSTGDFLAAYREVVDRGATAIISTHLSSGISGTVNSARLAAEQLPGIPVEVIDTCSAAAAHMITVEAGAEALAAGASFEETAAVMHRIVAEQRTVFSLDTLEYLYKGGRIGGAAALVGSLLQFRPLLYFRDGKIEALERVRGSSRALVRMAEVMAEWLGDAPLRVTVMEAACRERALALVDLLPRYLQFAECRVVPLTPVIGTHAGPGTLGLCCCPVAAFATGSR